MSRDKDVRLLEMLHLRDIGGLYYREIADRFGMSKSAAIGALKRIDAAADAVSCRCYSKKNRNGGMPLRWWAG